MKQTKRESSKDLEPFRTTYLTISLGSSCQVEIKTDDVDACRIY